MHEMKRRAKKQRAPQVVRPAEGKTAVVCPPSKRAGEGAHESGHDSTQRALDRALPILARAGRGALPAGVTSNATLARLVIRRAATIQARSGTVMDVNLERPTFSQEKRADVKQAPTLRDPSGTLAPEHGKRQTLAWEEMKLEVLRDVTGLDYSGLRDYLATKGHAPSGSTKADLEAALWGYARERFERIGVPSDASATQDAALGRLAPVLGKVMEQVVGSAALEDLPLTRDIRAFGIEGLATSLVDSADALRDWFREAATDPEVREREQSRDLLGEAMALFEELFPEEQVPPEAEAALDAAQPTEGASGPRMDAAA